MAIALGIGALSLLHSAGCTPAPVAKASQQAARTTKTALPVAQSIKYREATVDFAHHDVSGALKIIDSLLLQADLTETDRDFLQHQQAICHTVLEGKPLKPSQEISPQPLRSTRAIAEADCGPRALLLACQQLHVPVSLEALRHAAGTTSDGTNLSGLIQAAKIVGLKAEGVQMDGAALANLDTKNTPALAWVDGNHYVTVVSVHGDSATIHDPNKKEEEDISLTSGPDGLLARSGGIMLLLSRSAHALAVNKATGM